MTYTSDVTPFAYYPDLDLVLGHYEDPEDDIPHSLILIPRPLLIEGDFDGADKSEWTLYSSDDIDDIEDERRRAVHMMANFIISGKRIGDASFLKIIWNNAANDPQQNDVYTAEADALHDTEISRDAARKLVARIAKDYRMDEPEVFWDRNKGIPIPFTRGLSVQEFLDHVLKTEQVYAEYSSEDHAITMKQEDTFDRVAIHEAAHAVDNKTVPEKLFDWVPSHGARYVRVYQEALRRYMPESAQPSVAAFIEECRHKDLTGEALIEDYPDMPVIQTPYFDHKFRLSDPVPA